ncbi:MAG: outer-membrane lipoprotein carrier protein LolA [Pseudomonadota bacterium]
MVMGLVSTIAIALAFGPQLHVTLQAVVDEAVEQPATIEAPVSDAIETPVETQDVAGEPQSPAKENQADALPVMEETVITPVSDPDRIVDMPVEEDAEPAADTALGETDPAPIPVPSGAVPEAEWPAILADASDALAAARTARGAFIQSNADGSVVTGSFALNRPGRMRFDYDDPTPILIVSDGTTVAIEDRELDTVDRVPIGTTPLGLLLSTRLNVEADVDVLGIMQRGDDIGIRVRDASGELDGTLTMVFDKATYALKGWLTIDGNEQTTVVDLMDVETNIRIDPRQFRLNEDDEDEDER